MAGKIQKVRIGYSATLKIRAPEEEAQYMETCQYGQCVEPMRPQHENSLENLDSVYRLRYRSTQEELEENGTRTRTLGVHSSKDDRTDLLLSMPCGPIRIRGGKGSISLSFGRMTRSAMSVLF